MATDRTVGLYYIDKFSNSGLDIMSETDMDVANGTVASLVD